MEDDLDMEADGLPMDDATRALIETAENDTRVDLDKDAGGRQQKEASYAPVRDDHGRFTAKTTDESDAASETIPESAAVPAATMKEFKELIEAHQRAERAERELQALRTAQPKEAKPDPLQDAEIIYSDPAAFRDAMRAEMERQRAEDRLEMHKFMAEQRFGDELEEARKALTASGDAALADSLMRKSGNPFEHLVNWHRREKTFAALPNGDLKAYEASLQEKLLKNPEFLARAIEAAKAQATPGVPASRQPQTNVHRLPSASRAGTAAAIAAIPDDLSDADLLNSIVGRRH